jgi:hypothetical protein
MGFYTESVDRPYVSRTAGEDIDVGTLVVENGSDAYRRANAEDDSRLSHLAARPRRGDFIAFDEDDTLSSFTYDAADNDRVPGQPLVDGDLIKTKTAKDAGGNESAPSISDGDVVGVVDTSAGTLTSESEYEGRIVQEGYTDGESTPTTYNRSNDNFIALGKAVKDSADSYDAVVRVRVNRENLQ